MDMIPTSSGVIKNGDTYGRYTVLGIYQERNKYPKYAYVRCSCGSEPRFVLVNILRRGESKSCGCFHKERVTKHGEWQNPLFKVWKGMMSRCYNQKDKRYPRYGGLGIKVCKRWRNMPDFLEDMSPSYRAGLTIDRKNNNGDYSPENCWWRTRKQQNRNYSRNIFLTHNEKTMCLSDWAKETGIDYSCLRDRIKRGWPTKKALTTPSSKSIRIT